MADDNEGTNEPLLDGSGASYKYSEKYHPPFLPVLILAFPIMPLFWEYHVTVSEDGKLSFGYSYSIVQNSVDAHNVVSAEPIEHINGLLEFGGWGIRKNLNWETGYISKNGPGIKIVVSDEKDKSKTRTITFNCDDPEKVISLIQNAK